MLCYVGGTTRKYFKWEDNQWSEFSSGNGGGNSLIFRVDTIEDRDSINTVTLEYRSPTIFTIIIHISKINVI